MQIKHGGCCLSACRCLCALINLCNFSRHKWGCYRFCVTGWASERWLIGYGWIIHLNRRIAASLCGPRQWLSERWWAECWEQYGDVGEWKWWMLLQQTFLYQQKCFFSLPAWWNLDVIQRCISHSRPYCTIKHFRRAQMNWSLLLWQYSSISWSCMFW